MLHDHTPQTILCITCNGTFVDYVFVRQYYSLLECIVSYTYVLCVDYLSIIVEPTSFQLISTCNCLEKAEAVEGQVYH